MVTAIKECRECLWDNEDIMFRILQFLNIGNMVFPIKLRDR